MADVDFLTQPDQTSPAHHHPSSFIQPDNQNSSQHPTTPLPSHVFLPSLPRLLQSYFPTIFISFWPPHLLYCTYILAHTHIRTIRPPNTSAPCCQDSPQSIHISSLVGLHFSVLARSQPSVRSLPQWRITPWSLLFSGRRQSTTPPSSMVDLSTSNTKKS